MRIILVVIVIITFTFLAGCESGSGSDGVDFGSGASDDVDAGGAH